MLSATISLMASTKQGRRLSTQACVALAALLAVPNLAAAKSELTEHFSPVAHSSTLNLDHGPWTRFLQKHVLTAGHAQQRMYKVQRAYYRGSRHKRGSGNSPSRFENNRVAYHLFDDAHESFVRSYRAGLEATVKQIPLGRLNRTEQLAYWLNLYNARVMEWMIEVYPIRRLPSSRDLEDAPWSNAAVTVDGRTFSLRQLETEILFPLWKDPRVLYGLYQAAIGGPRLPSEAFTGENVYRLLEENAYEFINSNRGMLPDGEVLRVSSLYKWGGALFENSSALVKHIRRYAVAPFSDGLSDVKKLRADLYNDAVADIIGGDNLIGRDMVSITSDAQLMNNPDLIPLMISLAPNSHDPRLPPWAVDLVLGMNEHNNRNPRVYIVDCDENGVCERKQ